MGPTDVMVSVAQVRDRARMRAERDRRLWAASGGEDAVLEVVLHPPTEKAALADLGAAIVWTQSWHTVDAADPDAQIVWAGRQWPSAGAQSVPERCILRGADAIAAFAGADPAREWRVLRGRAARIRAEFGEEMHGSAALATAIRAQSRTVLELTDLNFDTLLHVVTWLAEHPSSGSRIRQLPIRGIDTKWLERHRSVVEAFHTAVTGRPTLGLVSAPALVRVRFLDPALRPGGLCDTTLPIDELAGLDIAPTTVFIFENLETVLAMPELPGAVVVHGAGYAVPRLHAVPWIRSGRVIYWGDLDSDGFAILHALRTGCTNVTSVLMDEGTLLAYRDLWVPETKPATGAMPTLTGGEQRALQRIRIEGNVRLEQERISWESALRVLTALV